MGYGNDIILRKGILMQSKKLYLILSLFLLGVSLFAKGIDISWDFGGFEGRYLPAVEKEYSKGITNQS